MNSLNQYYILRRIDEGDQISLNILVHHHIYIVNDYCEILTIRYEDFHNQILDPRCAIEGLRESNPDHKKEREN